MEQQNNNQAAAILPRRSRRLATIIPASHWIGIGYSQAQATAMERLQNDMKKYCDWKASHWKDNEINLVGKRRDILPHHDMMLPHWQKLLKTLRTNIDTIKIFNISLPVAVLDIMFPSFQSLNLVHLTLHQTGLGSGGLLKLSSFIKESTSIQNLVIGVATFNLSVAKSLSDAIKEHPSLERIGFTQCGLDENMARKVLEGVTRLRLFGLSFQKLGLESVNVIAEFIRSNQLVEIIQLGRDNISDSDVLVLASALKTNTNLRQLDLQCNDITEEGEKTLLKAMYDPTSMESIVESNHVCKAFTYDINKLLIMIRRPPIEREILNINNDDISIKQKIRKKVVLALCGLDGGLFDLSHLNDLPLQLMPRVLGLIQEHSQTRINAVRRMPGQLEKDALSSLFHTLRGWDLPLLFENLGSPSAMGATRKRRNTRR